jgi:kynurenine formamidase
MSSQPSFDDLPLLPDGGRSGLQVFGAEDNLGTINRLQQEQVVTASRSVRRGAVFSLNAPMNAFANTQFNRVRGSRVTIHHPRYFDDCVDGFALQGASHWDSLGHVGYDAATYYNGATEDDVASGRRNTIEHWARRGIAGRGVLLDLARALKRDGRPYHPGSAAAFTVADLELARAMAGITYEPGDILLIHSGFAEWFAELDEETRNQREFTAPGVDHTEEICRYLWDSGIAAIASDTFSVEVWPPDWSEEAFPWGQLHVMLIGQLGMALGEMWWLTDLAADCAEDRRYDFLLTSAPLNVPGAYGSPACALAIK